MTCFMSVTGAKCRSMTAVYAPNLQFELYLKDDTFRNVKRSTRAGHSNFRSPRFSTLKTCRRRVDRGKGKGRILRPVGREINLERELTNAKKAAALRLHPVASRTKTNHHERRRVGSGGCRPVEGHVATRLFRSQHHGGQRACRKGS
jgi:hypothetical protein